MKCFSKINSNQDFHPLSYYDDVADVVCHVDDIIAVEKYKCCNIFTIL